MNTRYPVFIPSKGRWAKCHTAKFMLADGLPFRLVVEPAEAEQYRAAFPDVDVLVTPRDNMRLLGTRNFIRDVSIEEGHARHWQFDDNIRRIMRWQDGTRYSCDATVAVAAAEDFTDRYTNIGVSGFNYDMFPGDVHRRDSPPFRLNCHVYSATLVNNNMPYRWRLLYNDDTDLCLQVLAGGMCTVQVNQFLVVKITTMQVKGGNTDDLYRDDGRLVMARSLERAWPGVVTVRRRFGRPQHHVDWRKFRTRLERRTDLDWDAIEARTYNLQLRVPD